jgi:RNA polymerase sigma-70 factor (ECF subfamily)
MTAAPDTEELLRRTADGDAEARNLLLARHQGRLRQMVAVRLDHRLAARVDPSDAVQEVLVEADRRLADYLRERPLPFYPWLRQLATERLLDLHRRHLHAQRRSVRREEPGRLALPEESAEVLADRLAGSTTNPSEHLLRQEARQRVRAALEQLSERDREVLELRHLEGLSVAETAAALGVAPGTVKTRHLRALTRLRRLLEGLGEQPP